MISRSSTSLPTDTRHRIIDAAASSFSRDGFRATTVRRIAFTANVNDVTIFRYFPKKQELYWQALEWKIRNSGLPEDIRTLLEHSPSPTGLVEGMLASVLSAVASDPLLPRLIQFAVMELEKERRMLDQFYLQPMLNSLISRLKVWITEGKLRPVDPVGAAHSILGLLFVQWSALPALVSLQDEKLVLTERVKLYADLCVRGLVE